MKVRNPSRVAVWIGGSSIVLMTAGLVLMFVDRTAVLPPSASQYDWSLATALSVFANIVGISMGTVVAARRPDNRIGWFFIAAGTFLGVNGLAAAYSVHALIADPGSWPGGNLAAWIAGCTNFFPIYMLCFIFLLFPTGEVRSPRWRSVWWLLVAATSVATVATVAFSTASWHDPYPPTNDSPSGVIMALFLLAFLLPLAASLIASLTAVIVRAIYSTGDERLQIKWFATGATLVVLSFLINFTSGQVTPAWISVLQSLAFIFLFSTIAIAVLKYRLYEIDVVINRAVVYGTLAVFITVIYAAIVVGVGTLVGGQSSKFLAAVAAAVIAIAFQPVRERSRRVANRLVYGKRATPYEVLSDFAERVAGTYAVDDVLPRTAHILAEGVGARSADVWVRVGSELRTAGSWPSAPVSRVPVTEDVAVPGTTASAPVRYQGELLGALSVTKAPGEMLTSADEKLLADVAAQAGLVLRNFGLIEELRASRQRLVAAQDAERRKIERNLHDGVQQQLVALNVQAGLLARAGNAEPSKVAEIAGQLQTRATEALDDLRDLARGIYPPLLADKGLGAALEAQARKAAVPVSIDTDGVGRYDQPVEAAVYFCTLEALNNIAKYAAASQATVSLRRSDGHLSFTVTDDGIGFDTAATGYGTGLQGMADRLDAIGGTLQVISTPGTGTSVSGSIPVV
ncbi:MAG TPA: GAF domain-containing sensor histidine kinase [Actinomycetota bacterium]|nr:GAF domain-containing sensor histidine kinase [Actinomycetota bacterium]